MTLYNYQAEAVDAIFKHFRLKDGNPLVVAPTGSGKSHILAGICQRTLKQYPTENILIVTHTQEIIQQDANIIKKYVGRLNVGVYSAGLQRREIAKFTVASIQSVYAKGELFKKYNLVIVDEAHKIPPSGEGMYRTLLKHMPHAKVVGLTATPFRLGHGYLTEGHIFSEIVYDISVQKLIDDGKLTPLTSKATEYALDTKQLKVIAGDYSKSDMSRKLDNTGVTEHIVKELLKFKNTRKAWLLFAIDIEHCEHIANLLVEAGIHAVAVHSKLDVDRKLLLDLFKDSHVQAVVSVETLTTGFDAPNIDLIGLLRPTQSPVLHVQMLGRGMRIAPNKTDCLVLDFAGNVRRLGPVDDIHVASKGKKKGKGNGTGFTRVCPKCAEIVHISKKVCPSCKHVFEVASKLEETASTDAVLKKDNNKITRVSVQHASYSAHYKHNKPVSLKVTYICGLNRVYKWVFLEHTRYARTKAVSWWLNHAGYPIPVTVKEALKRQDEIKCPKHLHLARIGKYVEIVKEEM